MLGKKVGRRQAHSRWGDMLLFLFLALVGVFMALPFVYAVAQSLKPMEELLVFPPKFFVRNPTIENFSDLFMRTNNMWVPFERYIFNSLLVTVIGTAVSVLMSCFAAYPLAKFTFPGSRLFEKIVVLSLLFVYEVTYIPQYIVLSKMGLIDTLWALLLPAFASSLGLYLMKNFMVQLPNDLVEAAKVDGAGNYYTFWHIIMPNVKPAWITLVILQFQGMWNRDTGSYIYTEQLKNLPAIFRQISTSSTIATAGISAASAVLLMIPPILVFLFTQSKVVETMAYSGIKG